MAIVISGRAVTTSLGHDPETLLSDLLDGKIGASPFRHPDADHFRTTIAFEVPTTGEDPGPFRPKRASVWVTRLIRSALADARIDDLEGKRVAVVVGTGERELSSVELWATDRGPAVRSDELSYRRAVTEAIGPVRFLSILGACAAGLTAVGIGADLLEDDEADTVIAVGVEPLHATTSAMYDRVATRMTDVIRPFDADRVGTIFGEGAAAVVLERVSDDEAGGKVLIRGTGFSSDARRSTAPDIDGIMTAISGAHERAHVRGDDINLVLAHGTGTHQNDDAEAIALTRVGCTSAFVTSVKPMIGHTLASSGLISLVVAAGCLQRGVVPPTLHLETKCSSASSLTIPSQPITGASLRYAQVDAFGFGGINAVAVLELVA